MLRGDRIVLRSLEASDLHFLHHIENNLENWIYGSENRYFTKDELLCYIANARVSIRIAKQYRFVIDNGQPIGFIDLFDYSDDCAYIGIIIDVNYRRKNYASDALELLISYSFESLQLSFLKCIVKKDNFASNCLFVKNGFCILNSDRNFHYYILKNHS